MNSLETVGEFSIRHPFYQYDANAAIHVGLFWVKTAILKVLLSAKYTVWENIVTNVSLVTIGLCQTIFFVFYCIIVYV